MLSLGINSAEKFWQPLSRHTEKYFDLVININNTYKKTGKLIKQGNMANIRGSYSTVVLSQIVDRIDRSLTDKPRIDRIC